MKTIMLSENIQNTIAKAIAKYPIGKKRSALKTALMAVQEEHGFLTEPLMDAVAQILEIDSIGVYEVASFYSLFELAPVGKYKMALCTNISCWLRGSDRLLHCIEEKIGIKPGETSEDSQFTLKEVECLAACGQAPAMQINGIYAGPVSEKALERWLENPEGDWPCF
jgi:NADH-quinone oxidoreductase subunit E